MRTKCGCVLALCLAGVAAQAIEGLQIVVQHPNVVLSWPSVVGETYQVLYRPTLNRHTLGFAGYRSASRPRSKYHNFHAFRDRCHANGHR
jgi:hypothetical protein